MKKNFRGRERTGLFGRAAARQHRLLSPKIVTLRHANLCRDRRVKVQTERA